MSIEALLTQRCTVVRLVVAVGAVADRYNDKARSEAVALRRTYPCRLEQVASAELLSGRDTTTSTYRLFLPAEAELGPADEVEQDGRRFRVVGAPVVERTPAGAHHVEALLEYVEGGPWPQAV